MFSIQFHFSPATNLLIYCEQHKQRSYVKTFCVRLSSKMSNSTIELSVVRLQHQGYQIPKHKKHFFVGYSIEQIFGPAAIKLFKISLWMILYYELFSDYRCTLVS